MEKLDYIFAKGKLSVELDGKAPHINTDRVIQIVNGKHPLMDKNICVPLNFNLGAIPMELLLPDQIQAEKTVAIKTVGLHCLMAQCGLHIPCDEADICLNNQVLCDIGDGQNISENLSTFSAHITNVLDILKKTGRDSLVIMDELGSGTDPTEGMGIAIAILEELRKSNCLFLVTHSLSGS
jgi:dsDNA-specific endonuclease/ATPase MutS2